MCLVVEKDAEYDSDFALTSNMNQLFILAVPSTNLETILDSFEIDVQNETGIYNIYNHYEDYLLQNQTDSYLATTSFAFEVPNYTKDALILKSSAYAGLATEGDYMAVVGATSSDDFTYTTLRATKLKQQWLLVEIFISISTMRREVFLKWLGLRIIQLGSTIMLLKIYLFLALL